MKKIGKILMWIFFFPIMLTIFIIKKENMKKWLKVVILIAFWGVLLLTTKEDDITNEVGEKISESENEIENYADKSIDLVNLDKYPFGISLENVLDEIGVDDVVEAECEVDNSFGMTIRLTTSTKRLWISIDDYFADVRNVQWIKDYDSNDVIYYYISDELGLNEPVHSYKTGEILIDKVDGESENYPLIVTAQQLADEINTDIDAAKEKYNGKWIQITGTVTYISDGGGMYGYYLYGKRGSDGLKITCWVNKDEKITSVGITETFLGRMREVTTVNNTEIAECKIIE